MDIVEQASTAFAAGQTTAERQAAEQILLQFKQSPNAVSDSMHLLTHSKIPMAQFHAVSTLREINLLDRITLNQRKETIGYLLNHVTISYSNMPNFVSSSLIVTIAVLIKRNWLQESQPDRKGMVAHMIQLTSSESTALIGTKLLLAFVTEMRGGSDKRTSVMGQPLAFHNACRLNFQREGLEDIAALAVHMLHQSAMHTLEHVYLLTVELLQWFETTDSSILLQVDPRWQKYIVSSTLIKAIFDTYTTHRGHSELSHIIRQVLILIASVSGSIFSSTAQQVGFISWIFQGALFIFHNPLPSNIEREVVDMCQLTYRLVSNWSSLNDPSLADPLVSEVANLSTMLLQSALHDAATASSDSDLWQMEGLDILMDAWSILTANITNASAGLENASAQVVQLYLQVRLILVCNSDDNAVDEDEDIEENVAKTLEEQLGLVAALARLNSPKNISLCQSLLQETIQIRRQHPTKSLEDEAYRHVLDKLHFLVLFTGIVLADDYEGEKPSIPSAMEISLNQVDPLIQLILGLLAEEIAAVDAAPNHVSPYVSEQLLSTVTRIHATYFERFQSIQVIELYCQSATVYLKRWYAQPHIIQNVVNLFLTFPKTHAIELCMQSNTFQSLVRSILSLHGELNYVPSTSRGLFCEALIRIVVLSNASILSPFVSEWHHHLNSIVSLNAPDDVQRQQQVEIILELFAGLARSTESRSFQSLEPLTMPWFPLLISVLNTFKGVAVVIPLVLKCACEFIEANLAYLPMNKAMELYRHSDQLIRVYCASNPTNQRTLSEEEQFEDLFMLLTLLSHLVSKDVIDFAEDTGNSSGIVADVVFSGLNLVIPLMTNDLLQYPKLSIQYFTLVSYLVDVYPEKVIQLNPSLLNQLLSSLVVGMQHTHTDIVRYSFQSVGELAAHQLKTASSSVAGFSQFIPIILNMLVFETSPSVVLDGAAVALYSLLLLERSNVFPIAQEFCSAMDPQLQQTMMQALDQLTQQLPDLKNSSVADARKSRGLFKTQLYAFVAHVRACHGCKLNVNAEIINMECEPAMFGKFIPPSNSFEGSVPIKLANPMNACTPLNREDTLMNAVFVVERGTCSFTDKIQQIEKMNGTLMILINSEDTLFPMQSVTWFTTPIAAISIRLSDGEKLKKHLKESTNSKHEVVLTVPLPILDQCIHRIKSMLRINAPRNAIETYYHCAPPMSFQQEHDEERSQVAAFYSEVMKHLTTSVFFSMDIAQDAAMNASMSTLLWTDTPSPMQFIQTAHHVFASGHFQLAQRLYENATHLDSKSQGSCGAALSSFIQGDYATARHHYKQCMYNSAIDPWTSFPKHFDVAITNLKSLFKVYNKTDCLPSASNQSIATCCWTELIEGKLTLRFVSFAVKFLFDTYTQMGVYLDELGAFDESLVHFNQAFELCGASTGLHIRIALAIPTVFSSTQDMQTFMENFEQQLDELSDQPEDNIASYIRPEDSSHLMWTLTPPTMFVGYQATDPGPLQRKIANMYYRLYPSLKNQGYFTSSQSHADGRIRIGFVSSWFRRHSVGKLFQGIFHALDRTKLHVTAFGATHFFPNDEELSDEINQSIHQAVDAFVVLSPSQPIAIDQILSAQVDILVYPEIGMDSWVYFLAAQRLAPIQCMFWGHPITTGLPTIDYFIASEYFFSDLYDGRYGTNDSTHGDMTYSEQLVLFSDLSVYFSPKVALKPLTLTRAHFDLPQEATVYICPQTLMKLHVHFDTVIARILKEDSDAIVVFLCSKSQNLWKTKLRRRLMKSLGPRNSRQRVRFVETMPYQSFMELLSLADVMLDPFPFGGGVTTLDAFHAGLPVITLPNYQTVVQLTAGFYRYMNFTTCITHSIEEYTAKAIRIANDKALRDITSQAIQSKANCHIYVEPSQPNEWTNFFVNMARLTQQE